MAVQKTYTLPRAVTALSHTLTMSGVSNKNILIAFRSGQVFSVDMRQIHPRRPMSDPSQSGQLSESAFHFLVDHFLQRKRKVC